MTDQVTSLLDAGLDRYKAGEGPDTLIPVFKEICDRTPKQSAPWTCLAWLYLLDNKGDLAYKAAQKAVKSDPAEPQARINMAIAMLETGQKGVRQHIEAVEQIAFNNSDLRRELQETLEEGLSRKPDWDSLKRVKSWLFPS